MREMFSPRLCVSARGNHLAALGEEPVHDLRVGEGRGPAVVFDARHFAVAEIGGMGGVGPDGRHDGTGILDRHDVVCVAVDGPDWRRAAGLDDLLRRTSAADGNRGGEEVRPARKQVPCRVAAHGIAADVDARAIHGKRGEFAIQKFERRGHVARRRGIVGVDLLLPRRIDPLLVHGALRGQHDRRGLRDGLG